MPTGVDRSQVAGKMSPDVAIAYERMRWIRGIWSVLAVLGIVVAVWNAFEPAWWSSMSCGKSGTLSDPGARPGATCDDPMWVAYDLWRLVLVGVLLGAAPAAAALVMRWWTSWLAVAALIIVTAYGLMHWTGFWGVLLLGGVPITLVALAIATVHSVLHLSAARRPAFAS